LFFLLQQLSLCSSLCPNYPTSRGLTKKSMGVSKKQHVLILRFLVHDTIHGRHDQVDVAVR
jgi:hypothetical protein